VTTTYRTPRETGLEGLGPFTVTEGATPDTTFQLTIHRYGVRPSAWFDSETIDGQAGCVGIGTASAHWSALMATPGKYRISLRDKETPSFERVGVADLYIT
jgi:hypothetical protein